MGTVRESGRVAIRTKYYGPTNNWGSRIRVWRADDSPRRGVFVGWDYSLGVEGNHTQAIRSYIARIGWDGEWVTGYAGDGYVAVMVGGQS